MSIVAVDEGAVDVEDDRLVHGREPSGAPAAFSCLVADDGLRFAVAGGLPGFAGFAAGCRTRIPCDLDVARGAALAADVGCHICVGRVIGRTHRLTIPD